MKASEAETRKKSEKESITKKLSEFKVFSQLVSSANHFDLH